MSDKKATALGTVIYLDCTATYYSGTGTGIQRVVRNFVRRKNLMEAEFNIKVVLIASILGKFYEIDPNFILNPNPATAALGTRVRTQFDLMKQKLENQVRWPKFCLPVLSFALRQLEWILKKIFWLIKYVRVYQSLLLSQKTPIKVRERDILVLLDAFWQFDLSKSLQKAKAKQVVTVMYDLIPVFYGEYVESVNRKLFINALPWVLKYSDRFLCISKDVQNQLKNYCESQKVYNKRIDNFNLGADFSKKAVVEKVRPEWGSILAGNNVWLMVGTIEPRKNHKMALEAFDILWTEDCDDKLLIIGRLGWDSEVLLNRIVTHPEYNKRLYFIGDATDSELQVAYQKSAGLIFTSFAEGFGLPLVEAMSMKIKVVCSDIAIFREVGGTYPTYFNLENPTYLVEALKVAKTKSESPAAVHWMTWDDSIRDFTRKLLS